MTGRKKIIDKCTKIMENKISTAFCCVTFNSSGYEITSLQTVFYSAVEKAEMELQESIQYPKQGMIVKFPNNMMMFYAKKKTRGV